MEVAFQNDKSGGYAVKNRMYTPTKDSSAYAYEAMPLPAEPYRRPLQPEPQKRPAAKPRPVSRPRISAIGKLSVIAFIGALTAAFLLVIMRYAAIAVEQNKVNEISANIESAKLRMAELSVALQCSVDVEKVKEVARKNGMSYPKASQYVAVGEEVPDQLLHPQHNTVQPEDSPTDP